MFGGCRNGLYDILAEIQRFLWIPHMSGLIFLNPRYNRLNVISSFLPPVPGAWGFEHGQCIYMHVCSDSGEDLISTEVLTVHSWPDLDATSKELQSRHVDLLMEQSL